MKTMVSPRKILKAIDPSINAEELSAEPEPFLCSHDILFKINLGPPIQIWLQQQKKKNPNTTTIQRGKCMCERGFA